MKNPAPAPKATRTTPIREAVLRLLRESPSPLTVPQIQEFLRREGLSPNKTTLYRQIESLVDHQEIVSMTLRPGVTHYEHTQDQHHHFLCDRCEDIVCVSHDSLEESTRILHETLLKSGLQVRNQHLSLEGTCQKCL